MTHTAGALALGHKPYSSNRCWRCGLDLVFVTDSLGAVWADCPPCREDYARLQGAAERGGTLKRTRSVAPRPVISGDDPGLCSCGERLPRSGHGGFRPRCGRCQADLDRAAAREYQRRLRRRRAAARLGETWPAPR